MNPSNVVIVTITLARTAKEEGDLLAALGNLAAVDLPLIIADGGSSEQFVAGVRKLTQFVIAPPRPGLVPQVKAGLKTALRKFPGKSAILYTEPDKHPFFKSALLDFLKNASAGKMLGVSVAGRDSRSFRTFPEGQRRTEGFMNEAFSWLTGMEGDYCYGPLLLSRRAAELALESPNDLGWGWRFWTMRRALAEGLKIAPIEMYVPCPKGQRGEDSTKDRIYRLKQLKQNLAALEDSA